MPLRIVRFSGTALTFGPALPQANHPEPARGLDGDRREGAQAGDGLASREKTVADGFKYRHKVGLDVAIEALRDYLRSRRRSVDALMEAATACRVRNVMRPYLEATA